MADRPIPVQLRRTKGWRMPPNTVRVSRPGPWGNPFAILNEEGFAWITDLRDPARPNLNAEAAALLGLSEESDRLGNLLWDDAQRGVVALFRERCVDGLPDLGHLRGKNLACFCGPDRACHADVLLELANRPTCDALPALAVEAGR